VGPPGLEPGTKGLCLALQFYCLFPACSLGCLLSLRPTRTVSTPTEHYCLAWFGTPNR